MRIGNVSKRVGTSTSWLRKLEHQGKIPRARRDRNGHRRYTPEDVDRIRRVIYPSGEAPEPTNTPAPPEPAPEELVEVALQRRHTINLTPYGPGLVRVAPDLAAVLLEGESRKLAFGE